MANNITRLVLALNIKNPIVINKKAEINSAFMTNLKSVRYWLLIRRGNLPREDTL